MVRRKERENEGMKEKGREKESINKAITSSSISETKREFGTNWST